uniref:Uncharacterized protein n=1 Tax=Trichobilharzia regenti TaxID=157069 RepID=A0AA85IT49_TRIRE|nr:unnamed protein product [Trichobilharzia regenti]
MLTYEFRALYTKVKRVTVMETIAEGKEVQEKMTKMKEGVVMVKDKTVKSMEVVVVKDGNHIVNQVWNECFKRMTSAPVLKKSVVLRNDYAICLKV